MRDGFAKRSVLMDLHPRIVSAFLLSLFHTHPTFKTVLLRLKNAAIEKVCAGVDPYVPKGKHDKRDSVYYVGHGDRHTLLFAIGKTLSLGTRMKGSFVHHKSFYEI